MRKTRFIYALIASALLSLAVTGCGSSETIENDMDVKTTEAPSLNLVDVGLVEVTETPTTTEAPTTTEVPTEAPKIIVTVKHYDVETLTEIAEADIYTFDKAQVAPNNMHKDIENYLCVEYKDYKTEYTDGYGNITTDGKQYYSQITQKLYTPLKECVLLINDIPKSSDAEIIISVYYFKATTEAPQPTETPVVEPTETPTIESTEIPITYVINGEGTYTYPRYEENQLIEENVNVILMKGNNNDGTTYYQISTESQNAALSITVIDKYTGIEFTGAGGWFEPKVFSDPSVTLSDGTVVEFAIEAWTMANENMTEVSKLVTVPAEYDGLLFVLNVYDESWSNPTPYLYFEVK